MFRGRILFAGYTALLAHVLVSIACHAKTSSSCGNVHNITDPFRLKGYRAGGNNKYELACENNRTVLNLYSRKYYVQAINYNNHTIRLVDVGIQKENCSSLPLHPLTPDNFSYEYIRPVSLSDPLSRGRAPLVLPDRQNRRKERYPYRLLEEIGVVVFMLCDYPVKHSPGYINMSATTGPCINSSFSSGKGHLYVLAAGGDVSVSDVADSCTVERVVMTTPAGQSGGNFSFSDVHDVLAFGFELRWNSEGTTVYSAHFVNGVAKALALLLVLVTALGYLLRSIKRKKEDQLKIERFLEDYRALKPSRYSYADVKKITNWFKEKIGQGGCGTVYKGKLSKDVHVAVKILDNAKAGNGDDFINEVGTIGRIHHVNVVRLVGYCAEGLRRALLYEFMPNHSLEKFISFGDHNSYQSLGWEKLQDIALGIAKGIEYLHQGCDQRILHLDIKPHNILLDHKFNPKISDFGLAKLCSKEQSVVSLTAVRGTLGYIAPEVFSWNFGNVSCKSDVYSFGMLLLVMVGGRKNPGTSDESQVYFPEWIYNRLERGEVELGMQMEETGDAKIEKKLTVVGLWCIQWYPVSRPSMKAVVQMLEGDGDALTVPPNSFSSTNPAIVFSRGSFDCKLEVISESD